MIRFDSDYITGAHPQVLQALAETNLEEHPGYGKDDCCRRAAELLRSLCRAPEAEVQFLTGGTQSNLVVIAAALRPHQGVVCAQTGHIHAHESGAVEATGHKILALPAPDGKLTAGGLEALCLDYEAQADGDYLVQPAMVYLSQPTELGTVYTLAELEAIGRVARAHGLRLFVDGARLVYALAASDVTLADLARLCDAFYLGGTKAGLLFGEAVVLTDPALRPGFRTLMKQRGAMLAKGWLLGVQFGALLSGGLYLDIGRRAVDQALRLRAAFEEKGWAFQSDSPTNQQFVILPDAALAALSRKYVPSVLERVDAGHTAVRFCTGWSTRDEDVEALVRDIRAL